MQNQEKEKEIHFLILNLLNNYNNRIKNRLEKPKIKLVKNISLKENYMNKTRILIYLQVINYQIDKKEIYNYNNRKK